MSVQRVTSSRDDAATRSMTADGTDLDPYLVVGGTTCCPHSRLAVEQAQDRLFDHALVSGDKQ
jgi:hypothetical protein